MGKNSKLILGLFVSFFLVVVVLGYTYLQSRQFLRGPQITVYSPKNGETFTSGPVSIEGNAQNIARITLNDNAIFVDSLGEFREKLLLLPGYNILTLKAEDRFGKKVQKTLELVYKSPLGTHASSTRTLPSSTL